MLKQLLSLFRREAPKQQEQTSDQGQHGEIERFTKEKLREMDKAVEEIPGKNNPTSS